MRIRVPPGLDEQRALGPDWGRWLDRLPRLFVGMLDEWDLTRDGEDLWHGFCSLVAPVISADGTRAVLKISFDGDSESLHDGVVCSAGTARARSGCCVPTRTVAPCCSSASTAVT